MAKVRCVYKIPRSFRLLDELNFAEKGKYPAHLSSSTVSLGLSNSEDMTLTNWSGSIIHCNNQKFSSCKISIPNAYPEVPPDIRFETVVALPGIVDKMGRVDTSKMRRVTGKGWDRTQYIMTVLLWLQKELDKAANLQRSIKDSERY